MSDALVASAQLPTQWRCTTLLLSIYGNQRSQDHLVQASKRLVAAGVSIEHVAKLTHDLATMGHQEKLFWQQMMKRDFSVEQMMAFAGAPKESKEFGKRTQKDIMKSVASGWKSGKDVALREVGNRSGAIGSIVVLGGIVSCASIQAYGILKGDDVARETATVVSQWFPHAVEKVIEAATSTLAGMGTTALIGTWASWKIGKAVMERRAAITKARNVSLDAALSEHVEAGSMMGTFGNDEITKTKLDAIPVAHRNLLSHLDGNELRLFLHGNDALRKEILASRPPSYAQRLACIQASDQSLFRKWIEELNLAGTSWNGFLEAGNTSLNTSVDAMRTDRANRISVGQRALS